MLIRSNLSSHAMVLGAVIAVVLPARLALKPQYATERRKIENQGRQDRTRELATQWNALPYLSTLAHPPSCGCLRLTGIFKSRKQEALFGLFRNCLILWSLKLAYDYYFPRTLVTSDAKLPSAPRHRTNPSHK